MVEQLYSTASYLSGDLSGIGLRENNLSGSNFAGKDLTDADLYGAVLTDADFSGSVVTGANFGGGIWRGLAETQFYSTASYQGGDLTGIGLAENNLRGWNFAGQNLSGADFYRALLTNADFNGALVAGADFGDTTWDGFAAQQLYSTASYQSGDVTGIGLAENNLSGWNFGGKDLADADFYNAILTDAEFSGAVVAGANFGRTTRRGFTNEQFYSTASYQSGELEGIALRENNLSGWIFAGKNLANADFDQAALTGADFTAAIITGASFDRAHLTAEQLYSTASYQSGDLAGVGLTYHYLGGWRLTGKNLMDTDFKYATFSAADFSFSDLRGASLNGPQFTAAATTESTILADGQIEGLALEAGERLVVRDYNGSPWRHPEGAIPITVESGMSLDPAAALRMVFEDDSWGSTISFEPGIGVSLGGSLELLFAEGTNPADLIGTTFDLFDWDGAVRSGEFEIVPQAGTVWDTTKLYTTGEVTLVPEPSTVMLLGIAAVLLLVGTVRFGRRSANLYP